MARRPLRWHHRPWAQVVVAWLAAAYIRIVHRSGWWRVRCDPATAALVRERAPFIGAFWHGRMMMMGVAWRALLRELQLELPLQPHVISSDHRDGRLMARATARFGLKTVFGSTRHGGIGWLRAAERVLADGQIAVVTPDGPRGPRLRAKPGVVRLAMITGAPIVPATFATRRRRRLRSWDRFVLVLPFASGLFAFGAPIRIAPDADPEAARELVEQRLNELMAETDQALGLAPEPAA